MTSPTLAVTTSIRPNTALEAEAQAVADELAAPLAPRGNKSLAEVFTDADTDRLLIVAEGRLRLRDRATGTEYFYHPNLFLTRGSQVLENGLETDPFLRATGLTPGDSLLDCTLGFASEAALASLAVGDLGRVVGVESVPVLACVTRRGVQSFPLQNKVLEAALRRVEVVTGDSGAFLAECADGAFDVVYFDPFFPERLPGSEASMSPLFVFGNPAPLDTAAVWEAQRVARRRVVIKHPRHARLPPDMVALVSKTVGSPKSRLVYSVIEGVEGKKARG